MVFQRKALWVSLAAASLLVACGGGGADTSPVAPIKTVKVMGDSIADSGKSRQKYIDDVLTLISPVVAELATVFRKVERGEVDLLIATERLVPGNMKTRPLIDGRFVTSPAQLSRPGQSEPQTQAATLRVMDELVARTLKERGAMPAPAKK
mgnify:CR=1 FL=1